MTARKILQNSIWSLRRKLVTDADADAPVALRTQPPGYSLDVSLDRIDLHLFHRWVKEGRSRLEAGEPDAAAALLNDALELWRGPALADLTEVGVLWPELTTLQNLRLDVLEDLFEAQLACGRHYAVLGELESLVESEPLRERACGQLMRALYRCGRQSDALGVFSRLRTLLVEELGLEPSRMLHQLQQAILTHDPSLHLPPAPERPHARPGTAGPLLTTAEAVLLAVAEAAPQSHSPNGAPDHHSPASTPPPPLGPAPDASHAAHAAPTAVLTTAVPTTPVPAPSVAEPAPQPHSPNGAPDGRPPAQPTFHASDPGANHVAHAVPTAVVAVPAPAPALPATGNGGAPSASSAIRRAASLLLVRAEPDPASTDPDQLDTVMADVGTLVHNEIERCGGVVVFTLEALTLALFPADPHDTDHPLHAIRAADALHTALTAPAGTEAGAPMAGRTELRAAVATGEVLVSQALGGSLPPRVYGATVKESESLLALAGSGDTLVCDRTRQETEEHFAYEELPGAPTRFRLLGVIEPEPFAGDAMVSGYAHQGELDLLQSVMTHSSRWSQPHLITVLSSAAEPRRQMLRQLGDFATGELDGAQVLTWNSKDDTESGPFGLHRMIISRCSGLTKSDPPWAVRRKVSSTVQRLAADKSCANWLVARCTSLFESSNRSPEWLGAEEWRDVWRYFLEAVAHDGPIVLIIDDLHLADPTTRELAGLMAKLPGRIPLTVVVGAAPEIERQADWSSDRRFATAVFLDKPSDSELVCSSDEVCVPG
ncbi:BTAD domain-containing putative transcriptional regulator [Streptomyces luteolifulvus]|uniref:BTAD domain-containing putative transcriptional regulator n=1 Tax=Streptomyces luteolifulvus TaxID=2615112 RepID=UPI001CD9C7A1|nr:BTAD domain-containing putative transcriptional regulator [Streptomyces luteolifulvus]